MRIRIHHDTIYRYEPPASGVSQILRLTPGNHDGQYVAEWRIDMSADARLDMRNDAFGNITHRFTIDGPLSELTVRVEGCIETFDTAGVLRGTVEHFPPSLFLRATNLTRASDEMLVFARALREAAGGDTLLFLHGLMQALHQRIAFDTDPTHPGTSAAEAFALGRGVCQDYAHIFISCARAVGIPARFIAGHFLRADGIVHQEAGHAWAEAIVPDLGWVGFDPANGLCVTDAHARVAVGLDYLGAAPVRGVRFGGGTEALAVAVRVDQAGRQCQS
jgi:transglutaminase-like putative cysteine protease